MTAIDLLAAWVPVYAEPNDFITIEVNVPVEFESGTWTGKLWDKLNQDTPTALFTVTPPAGSPVVLTLDTTNPQLVPPWATKFEGHWELDRTAGGQTRTWVKGDFILDPARKSLSTTTSVIVGTGGGGTGYSTPAEVLAAIKTVDGTGSGLDADLLDGLHATAFQLVDQDLTQIANLTPTDDDIIQRKAGVWTNRTIAQLIADIEAGGLTPSIVTVRSARVTAGDITLPNTAGGWQLLSGIAELTIPAVIGSWVEVAVHAMRSNTSTAFLDVVNVTGPGPTVQRYLTTGTSTPAAEGDPGWYPQSNNFSTQSGPRGFTVGAGDLDGGNVRFRLAVLAAGTGTLYASTSYPFYWQAKVYPQ